jgi:uncharacterized protein
MGKEKIVIDTNILISALGWNGKPRELFMQIIDSEFELIICTKQLAEIKRVLDYPKFGFKRDQKELFLKILLQAATIAETKTTIDIIKEDPSDNMLIECALENNAKHIISGDKHLKKLKTYQGIMILSVNDFLNRFKKQDNQ